METIRTIIFFEDYALTFIDALAPDVKKKIYAVLHIIQNYGIIPSKFFRNIETGLFEIRVEYNGNIYRIFCCFDQGSLVILLNGFQKKTQKTPAGEIGKARKLMQMYFEQKRKETK